MDPLLDEMNRAREVQPHSLRKWVAGLSVLIAAKDDQIETLKQIVAELRAQVAGNQAVMAAATEVIQDATAKRGPGRPRKEDAHV